MYSGRRILLTLAVFLQITLCSTSACATTSVYQPKYDERIQFSDVVCEALVIDKPASIESSVGEWFPWMDENNATRIVTRQPLKLRVNRVYQGNVHTGQIIDVIVMFPGYVQNLQPGQSALFCLKWHRYYKEGVYVISDSEDVLVKEGNSYIKKDGSAISRKDVQSAVDKVSLESISEKSEIVVVGRVQRVDKEKIQLNSRTVTVEILDVRIEEAVKGDSTGLIRVNLLNEGRYFPDWRKPMPYDIKEGSRWLMFLTKNQMGWYPYMGYHGMLKIDKEGSLHLERVPAGFSIKDVRMAISEGGR